MNQRKRWSAVGGGKARNLGESMLDPVAVLREQDIRRYGEDNRQQW